MVGNLVREHVLQAVQIGGDELIPKHYEIASKQRIATRDSWHPHSARLLLAVRVTGAESQPLGQRPLHFRIV